jgi:predicted dehydrogenase
MSATPRVRFSVIGMNHFHVYSMVDTLLAAGAELVSYFSAEADLGAAFGKKYPQAKAARSEAEILEDKAVHVVASAAIPVDRAPLGIRVLQHGKDFFVDKPGCVTLEQLAEVRRVQAETKRFYTIFYGERLESAATEHAGDLVKDGAIGRVVQTLGLGPHRANLANRPPWFVKKAQYGGILVDIGCHQFEQFLFFTNSTDATIVSSQIGNVKFPQHPELEDFGDCVLSSPTGTGYLRVDWYTPDGLSTYGDAKLIVLGTDGYMELRKNVDLAGRTGGNHLLIVDHKGTRHIDCSQMELPFAAKYLRDIVERTDIALPQSHGFKVMELALTAEKNARRL